MDGLIIKAHSHQSLAALNMIIHKDGRRLGHKEQETLFISLIAPIIIILMHPHHQNKNHDNIEEVGDGDWATIERTRSDDAR